jgi:CRP-like cAMP-binding protein
MFLSGMDPKHVEVITSCATSVRFPPDRLIISEGDEANTFFLITEGRVALEAFHLERGAIVIQTLGPGDVLGWSWLVPPYRWRLDARALEETHAFALDGRFLRARCEEDPELGFELLKRFAAVVEQRLSATRLQLLDVYSRSY